MAISGNIDLSSTGVFRSVDKKGYKHYYQPSGAEYVESTFDVVNEGDRFQSISLRINESPHIERIVKFPWKKYDRLPYMGGKFPWGGNNSITATPADYYYTDANLEYILSEMIKDCPKCGHRLYVWTPKVYHNGNVCPHCGKRVNFQSGWNLDKEGITLSADLTEVMDSLWNITANYDDAGFGLLDRFKWSNKKDGPSFVRPERIFWTF